MKIGYVRVSKQEQHEALQIDARDAKPDVRNGSWIRLLDQKQSARDSTRLWHMCDQGTPSSSGSWIEQERSLTHLIELLKGLKERGIGCMSLTEQIDTTTKGGNADLSHDGGTR